MADFPSAIYAPRTIENRPGVTYDADDTKTFFAEDHEQVTGEVVAIENALGANLSKIGLNGWLPLATIPTLQASDNPVYTLRFAADMTALIGLGNRIKLTQNGSVKYFIVVKVGSYTGGNTDIYVYGGTDYDMENTSTYPVTLPYYSISKAPFGFPLNPVKWTEEGSWSSENTQASPSANTWYNLGSISLSIPIGCWDVEISGSMGVEDVTTTYIDILVSLSDSNNSESDGDFTVGIITQNTANQTSRNDSVFFRHKYLSLTTKTLKYLIAKTTISGMSTLFLMGTRQKTIIRAICAYL